MSLKKYTALLAAFVVGNVYANPLSIAAAGTVSDAPTTTTSPAAEATCKFQVQNSADDLMPIGSYTGAEDALGCWEVCNDVYYSPYCTSFTYTPATKTCIFRDVRIRSGLEAADSGTYYWDKACWADYPTSASEATAPGCLATNATCGAYGASPNYHEFATFRKVTGGASECSEICNGASYASRCKSYIYQADEIGACYFYDLAATEILVVADGTRQSAWDKQCLDNSGTCAWEST